MRHSKHFFFILILAVICAPLFSENIDEIIFNDQRVAVLPLWFNEEDSSFGPELSSTVQTSIQWMLRMIDGYELVISESYPDKQDKLASYCSKNKLDMVIYGLVDISDNNYSISLLLYNAEKDSIQEVEKDEVDNIMDTFDLADQLSIRIIESFIGRKLEFGSILFINSAIREGAIYRCYVNGTLVGENLSMLSTFLAGTYQLEVKQIEGNDEFNIFNEQITVNAESTTNVNFAFVNYGYLNINRKGPNIPLDLTLNGETYNWDGSREVLLPVGEYNLVVETEPFEDGRVYLLDNIDFRIADLEKSSIEFNTQKIGSGISFITDDEGEYFVLVDGENLGNNIEATDLLTTGYHSVEVFQLLPDGERLSYKDDIWLGQNQLELDFNLAPPEEKLPIKDRSSYRMNVEIQALGGAYIGGGVHFELFGRHLGLSTIAAFSLAQGYGGVLDFNFNFIGKADYIPWPNIRFSPYIGGVLYLGTAARNLNFQIGPMIGLTINLNSPVFSSIFIECESLLRPGTGYMLSNQVTVGFRLF